jgi:hypothetical protein
VDQLDQVLAAIKSEYEPDLEAPKRVRALIGGSLSTLGTSQAAGSAGSGSGTAGSGSVAPGVSGSAVGTHSGFLGSAAVKGTVVALAVSGAAAVGIYSLEDGAGRPKARPAAVVVASAPTAMVQRPAQPTAEAEAQERLEAAPVSAPPAQREREASAVVRRGHTLEELQLLSEASQALSAGRLDEAQRALETHRTRYLASALARERAGLSLELRCTQSASAALRAEAERFVRADETSPISSSVQKKCLP